MLHNIVQNIWQSKTFHCSRHIKKEKTAFQAGTELRPICTWQISPPTAQKTEGSRTAHFFKATTAHALKTALANFLPPAGQKKVFSIKRKARTVFSSHYSFRSWIRLKKNNTATSDNMLLVYLAHLLVLLLLVLIQYGIADPSITTGMTSYHQRSTRAITSEQVVILLINNCLKK